MAGIELRRVLKVGGRELSTIMKGYLEYGGLEEVAGMEIERKFTSNPTPLCEL